MANIPHRRYARAQKCVESSDPPAGAPRPTLVKIMASTFRQDPHESPDTPDDTLDGTLDGSVAELTRFLREFVDITGQHDSTHTASVVELQFGGIRTSTALTTEKDVACLAVTALLPRQEQSDMLPLSSARSTLSSTLAGEWEILWHADNGHYVVVRKIPVAQLRHERSVMDAIADTADDVAIWFAGIGSGAY